MRSLAVAVLLAGCVTTPPGKPFRKDEHLAPPTADPQLAVRAAVSAFITAAEAKRFDEVLTLLARPLRDRYSPELLARDFGADPLASNRLEQIKLKLLHERPRITLGDGAASLKAEVEWAPGRSLRLSYEGGWRIAALE